jgi:biotin synthase
MLLNLEKKLELLKNILSNAQEKHSLSKDEIIELLMSDGGELFYVANEVRQKYKGDEVHLRGLVEFTNYCKNDCLYCGLRRENKQLERYRLSENEILDCVKRAVNANYKTIVLQGGEDCFFDTDKICKIIKEIKKFDVALTLSIGERTFEEYKIFKSLGADRYLMRIETTDKNLYKQMHPNMSFENRILCLENIKSLGYEVGTGVLVGLPNQTISSLADDILFFKKLNADMVGIGPLIPHPNTPLHACNKDNFDLSLKVMAITRLLLPDINIPATTAMESIRENGRVIALNSGANVVMPNMTDVNYRGKYELYPNKICITDSPDKCINCIKGKILSIGRTISQSHGFRNDKF